MSDKDRRKKDGRDKNKDRQAMRESPESQVRNRAEQSQPTAGRDTGDIINYKSGAPEDRNRTGAK